MSHKRSRWPFHRQTTQPVLLIRVVDPITVSAGSADSTCPGCGEASCDRTCPEMHLLKEDERIAGGVER